MSCINPDVELINTISNLSKKELLLLIKECDTIIKNVKIEQKQEQEKKKKKISLCQLLFDY